STTLPKAAPCELSAVAILAKTCRHCASKSSTPTTRPPASVASWPAMNRNSAALTRVICEYWPSGLPSPSGFWILISGIPRRRQSRRRFRPAGAGLELLEHLFQRRDLGLELFDALDQLRIG